MKSKIIVLDGYLINPGDLSWDDLANIGECQIYDRTSKDQVIERSQDAEIVLTNKVCFTREVISKLPKLKYIAEMATGYDNIDVIAAREKNILVSNVPSYGTSFVAQHTIALLLEAVNHVGLHNDAVRLGEWTHATDFCFWKKSLTDLSGLTMGIIGFGVIGKAVAKLASAFGMHVVVSSRSQKEKSVEYADGEILFQKSDVISLHCALTDDTRHLINEKTLSMMKPEAILLNASRGALINENDLAKALKDKKIAIAALDVLGQEPPLKENPLLNIENCIITPHIAWASLRSRSRLLQILVKNIETFLSGNPQNLV